MGPFEPFVTPIVNKPKTLNDGDIVSKLWTDVTGLEWGEAKKLGYTDGAKESNLKLKSSLLKGEVNVKKDITGQNTIYSKMSSIADKLKSKYGAQDFMSITAPKHDAKKPISWADRRAELNKVNKLSDLDKVIYANKDSKDQYAVIDKKTGKLSIYRGDKEVKSYKVGVGKNASDAQTATTVINGKTHWDKANYSTGAGIYTISGVNAKNKEYGNAPSFNMKNENGIEVSTAIHAAPAGRLAAIMDNNPNNNKVSTGCINGRCYDLEDLHKNVKLTSGNKVYILPEDKGNSFEYVDGKIATRMSQENRQGYQYYRDLNGVIRKGQGGNYSTNSIVYKPITTSLDWKGLTKVKGNQRAPHISAISELTTNAFIDAMRNRKQDILKATRINSDTYNDIANVAFGIYGTESGYGNRNSPLGNLARAVNKGFSRITGASVSSPDVYSKPFYGANTDNHSYGLTQIRWADLNEREISTLKNLGINNKEQLMDPSNAALATLSILAIRYQEQLKPSEKKQIMQNLPKVWNKASNYPNRVLENSKWLKISE